MRTKPYLLVSGLLFGIVAVAQTLRVLSGWSVTVGAWSIPVGVSGVAAVITGALCIWAFSLALAGAEGRGKS